MEEQFAIYIVSGDAEFDVEFTSDEIKDQAIDSEGGDSLNELLFWLIDGLNDDTLSDQNWYFVFDVFNGTLLSTFPKGINLKEL